MDLGTDEDIGDFVEESFKRVTDNKIIDLVDLVSSGETYSVILDKFCKHGGREIKSQDLYYELKYVGSGILLSCYANQKSEKPNFEVSSDEFVMGGNVSQLTKDRKRVIFYDGGLHKVFAILNENSETGNIAGKIIPAIGASVQNQKFNLKEHGRNIVSNATGWIGSSQTIHLITYQ